MSRRKPLGLQPAAGREFATLGGGCFWCMEAVFEELEGVIDVESGYTGGHVEPPTYRQVCGGDTGHAEVIRLEFDPARVSFREILEVFFVVHDPTTLNRQGADTGTQYRSSIFVHSDQQRRTAEEVIAELSAALGRPVVTEVQPAGDYFRAEDYHQEYFRSNPGQGYCMMVVSPKVEKFRRTFARKRKAAAAA
jgi:peptide-methionine (S)-S-oxide reductase